MDEGTIRSNVLQCKQLAEGASWQDDGDGSDNDHDEDKEQQQ